MRRNSDIPAEPLVAIDVVAASVGLLPEITGGSSSNPMFTRTGITCRR